MDVTIVLYLWLSTLHFSVHEVFQSPYCVFTRTKEIKLSVSPFFNSGLESFPVTYAFLLVDNSKEQDLGSLKCEAMEGFQELLFTQNLAHLKDVRCLDSLVRAHVLLAVMAERTSPEHQLNLLKAFTFVIQIWQVLPPSFIMRINTVDIIDAKLIVDRMWKIQLCSLLVPPGFHGNMFSDFFWD